MELIWKNRNKKELQIVSIENLEKVKNVCNMNLIEAKQRELRESRE